MLHARVTAERRELVRRRLRIARPAATRSSSPSHLYCGQPESDTTAHRRYHERLRRRRRVVVRRQDLHVVASGSPALRRPRRSRAAGERADVARQPGAAHDDDNDDVLPPRRTPRPRCRRASCRRVTVGSSSRTATIGETTDGGATWRRVGAIGSSAEPTPRSGSSTPPTASRSEPSTQVSPACLTTHDGGATWTAAEHAVLRGVRPRDRATARLRRSREPGRPDRASAIWSTPVDHAHVEASPTLAADRRRTGPGRADRAGGRTRLDPGRRPRASSPARGLGRPGRGSTWRSAVPRFERAGVTRGVDELATSSRRATRACGDRRSGGRPHHFSHDGGTTFTRHVTPRVRAGGIADPGTAVLAGERQTAAYHRRRRDVAGRPDARSTRT